MQTLTIKVKDDAMDKVLWLLSNLKDDVKIESKEKKKAKFLKEVEASLKDAKEGRVESITDIGRHIEELRNAIR